MREPASYFPPCNQSCSPTQNSRVDVVRVIPRSHLGMPPTPEGDDRWLPHPDECLLDLHAGDLVAIHSDLIHSGTPNASSSLRMYTSTYLCRIGLPHRDDFDADVIQRYLAEAHASSDARVLRFFGEGWKEQLAKEERGWATITAQEAVARRQMDRHTDAKL